MTFRFEADFILDEIVAKDYENIDAFKSAMAATQWLKTVDLNTARNAIEIPQHEIDPRHDQASEDHAVFNLDLERTDTVTTYVNGTLYNLEQKNEFLENYKRQYKQEHCKPFCHAIKKVSSELSQVSLESDPLSVPTRLQLKTTANSIRIFKKMGEKYYYIAIEQNINIQDTGADADSGVNHEVLFDVMTVFEASDNNLVFKDMFAPEGCGQIAAEYLKDPKSIIVRGAEDIQQNELIVFKNKLAQLQSKKPIKGISDKQKNAVVAILSEKQKEYRDDYQPYITLIDKSLAINEESTPLDYVIIAEMILDINGNDTDNTYHALLNEIQRQTNKLKKYKYITLVDILQYIELIARVKASGNNIYAGAGVELSEVMDVFILSILKNPKQIALYHFFTASSDMLLFDASNEYKAIHEALGGIKADELDESKIKILSNLVSTTHDLEKRIASINDEDIFSYLLLIEEVKESFGENPALAAAMNSFAKYLEDAEATHQRRQSSSDQEAKLIQISAGNNEIAERIIQSQLQNRSEELLGSLNCRRINLNLELTKDPEGWASHARGNETYILAANASAYQHYSTTDSLPAGDYSANHVTGLAYRLKPSIPTDEGSVLAKFVRIYNENLGYLYIVESVSFKSKRNYIEQLPYDVVHVYKKEGEGWKPEGSYAPEEYVEQANALITNPMLGLQNLPEKLLADHAPAALDAYGFQAIEIDDTSANTGSNDRANENLTHGRGIIDTFIHGSGELQYTSADETAPTSNCFNLDIGSVAGFGTIEYLKRMKALISKTSSNSATIIEIPEIHAGKATRIFKTHNNEKYCILIEKDFYIKPSNDIGKKSYYYLPKDFCVIQVFKYNETKKTWESIPNGKFLPKKHVALANNLSNIVAKMQSNNVYNAQYKELKQKNNLLLVELKNALDSITQEARDKNTELLTRVITASTAMCGDKPDPSQYLMLIKEVETTMAIPYGNYDLAYAMLGILAIISVGLFCLVFPPAAGFLGVAAIAAYLWEAGAILGVITLGLYGYVEDVASKETQGKPLTPVFNAMQNIHKEVDAKTPYFSFKLFN